MTRQTRDVGILFADIAGSMRLYEAFGNRGALAAIEMCLGVVGNVVSSNKGYVVKTIGDEIMACFPTAVDTWNAAHDAQRKVDALPALPGPGGEPVKLGLRVGFAFGQAIETNGDFFGATVNMAARMVQLAQRCQVITTGEAESLLPRGHRFQTRGLDILSVKGKPDGVPVVELLWQDGGGANRFTVIGLQDFPAAPTLPTALTLRLGFTDYAFDGERPSISIGRDPANDVVIPASSASRSHATIERRRDRWVLVDHSSNGTFVRSETGEMHLRREELILNRDGTIGFGHPTGQDPGSCVQFVVGSAIPAGL
jgi:adenylate cyclase